MGTISPPWWRPFKDAAKQLVESAKLPTPEPKADEASKDSSEPLYRYTNKALDDLRRISYMNGGISHGQASLLIDEILYLRGKQAGARPSTLDAPEPWL